MAVTADRVTEALSRVPRMTVDVGPRRLPAFRSAGILGVHVALLAALVAALVNDTSAVTVVGMSATAMLGFLAWGLLRRAVTGRESLVLLEYVWVALGLVTAYLWATGGVDARAVDAFVVGLSVFLAFGRLGCLTVGCCHGHRARWGVRYGPAHTHLSARLRSGPLLPVPLLESAALFAIAAVALAATAGPAGAATVWFLVSYAVVRFGTDALRGDRRPYALGVSVPRWMCLVQLVAGLLLAGLLGPRLTAAGMAVATGVLVVAAGAGLALVLRRGANPLEAPEHLDESWETALVLAGRAEGETPVTGATSRGMRIAVSVLPDGCHVSMSHERYDVEGVARALVPLWRHTGNGVTHVLLPPGEIGQVRATGAGQVRLLGAADTGYFEPRGAPQPTPVGTH